MPGKKKDQRYQDHEIEYPYYPFGYPSCVVSEMGTKVYTDGTSARTTGKDKIGPEVATWERDAVEHNRAKSP